MDEQKGSTHLAMTAASSGRGGAGEGVLENDELEAEVELEDQLEPEDELELEAEFGLEEEGDELEGEGELEGEDDDARARLRLKWREGPCLKAKARTRVGLNRPQDVEI